MTHMFVVAQHPQKRRSGHSMIIVCDFGGGRYPYTHQGYVLGSHQGKKSPPLPKKKEEEELHQLKENERLVAACLRRVGIYRRLVTGLSSEKKTKEKKMQCALRRSQPRPPHSDSRLLLRQSDVHSLQQVPSEIGGQARALPLSPPPSGI